MVIKIEFFPKLELGWFNGWIFLMVHVVLQAIFILTCSKEVKVRLFDRGTGWTKTQKTFTLIGKVFGLINIILIILSPLKFGSIEFIIGLIIFLIGITGLVTSIINFKNAPFDKPIATGLYKVSRNPQIVMVYIIILGYTLLIGSWLSMIILIFSFMGQHFSLLGEERRLTEQYGDSYLEYKKKVPRYLLFF
jgi:protein-S-isoprenylcysteine O-methyltransferase Ste14